MKELASPSLEHRSRMAVMSATASASGWRTEEAAINVELNGDEGLAESASHCDTKSTCLWRISSSSSDDVALRAARRNKGSRVSCGRTDGSAERASSDPRR